jgi:RES domain-containing protein
MQTWRICRAAYAAEAHLGIGASLFGGRWNSRGVRVVYTSASLALAAVETFVHLEPNFQPADLVRIAVEVPDALPLASVDPAVLPEGWAEGRDERLRVFGDAWVTQARTVGMRVPSAAITGEWNVLLNPLHPEFAAVSFGTPKPFRFDARMFR